MNQSTESRRPPSLGPEGFLSDDQGWDRELAEDLARKNGIWPLTPEHWQVIDFVRDYFQRHGLGPPVVKISRATGMNMARICELFPCGVVKGAYRIAGLPRPVGCI